MKKIILLGLLMTVSIAQARVGSEGVGGGNTLGGKMVESYIDFPADFKEYESEVQPVLELIKTKASPCVAKVIEDYIKNSTWYFVPAEIKQLTQEITGIPFSSSQTSVINIRAEEVWVDSTSYNSLHTDTERAKLLVHDSLEARLSIKIDPFDQNNTWIDVKSGDANARGLVALFFSKNFATMSSDTIAKKINKFIPGLNENAAICK